MNRRKRILFIGEAVTLAHVTRLLVLARSLDPARYEVHFACADRFPFVFRDESFRRWSIESISSEQFLEALAGGKQLYDYATLAAYAEEDRDLLARVCPDLVVGDFRLSLAVSAPLAGVLYAQLNNAYWSPYTRRRYPMPDLPMVRFLGVRLSNLLFQTLQPAALAWHAGPINRLRREQGLAPFRNTVVANTWADYTLYADVPGLVPMFQAPENHIYLGPIFWSPHASRPEWWDELPAEHPCVYVSLGTSGRVDILGRILDALKGFPLNIMLATAGRTHLDSVPDNVWVSELLPGEEAAARSALVICNGGSGTVTQALNEGVPVLGLPTNIDQYLVMRYVQEAGAGIGLRADRARATSVRTAVETLLTDNSYRNSARVLAKEFRNYNAVERFGKLLSQWLD